MNVEKKLWTKIKTENLILKTLPQQQIKIIIIIQFNN